MLDPHSSLFPGSNTSSEVPGQPISCVELTGQLLAPARPPDLHGLAYLAGACHSANWPPLPEAWH